MKTQYHPLVYSLSVVVHQNLTAPRMNPVTEQTRLNLLEAYSIEMTLRYSTAPSKARNKAMKANSVAVKKATDAYFKATEVDSRLIPMFRVEK